MRIDVHEDYAERLGRLAEAAGLSRARWVRAAIKAADEDPAIAQRIAADPPESGHGGHRPGAGRPRTTRTEDDHEAARHDQEEDDDG